MNTIDRNPLNIEDPAIRRLSEFLFANYHTNPGSKSHSRVSDQLAVNLAGDPEAVMELAGLLARTIDPNFEGNVIGFFVQRETKSLLEQLFGGAFAQQRDPMEDVPLVGFAGLEPKALWHRAGLWLSHSGFNDMAFDHSYAEIEDDNYRPGIHAEGVGIAEVNNALIQVLLEQAPQYLGNIGDWLATDVDDDGWVFSRVMVDEFDA